jgi:hypothetical protein
MATSRRSVIRVGPIRPAIPGGMRSGLRLRLPTPPWVQVFEKSPHGIVPAGFVRNRQPIPGSAYAAMPPLAFNEGGCK